MDIFRNEQMKIISIFFVLIIIFFVYQNYSDNTKFEIAGNQISNNLINKEIDKESIDNTKDIIYIDIEGEINNPGVYKVPGGTRMFTLIEVAGGLKIDADTTDINRTRELIDGEKIIIKKVYIETLDEQQMSNNYSEKKININTAEKSELVKLSGIGEVISERIIEYRNTKGFNSIEEIKNVKGIGEKKFEEIKDKISIK